VIADNKPNPFAVLALPTRASEPEIARRAQELSELAPTAEEGRLYRWAREQVITHPRTRLVYEVFEMPRAVYDDPGWESFERKYRRNPVDLGAAAAAAAAAVEAPALDHFDIAALISVLLENLLDIPKPDMAVLLAQSPVEVGLGPPPVEVRDVVCG